MKVRKVQGGPRPMRSSIPATARAYDMRSRAPGRQGLETLQDGQLYQPAATAISHRPRP
jgi:hypothetical protein